MKNKLLICLLISLQVIISEKLFAGADQDIAYSIESGLERLRNNDYPDILYLAGKNCPKPNQYQDLSKFKKLYHLELSNCKMGEIPKSIFQIEHLRTLYLDGNELTELPAGIGQLSHLSELYLNDNKLTELPAEIGQLGNLKKLALSKNHIKKLPESIGKLTKLKGASKNFDSSIKYKNWAKNIHHKLKIA